MTGNLIDFITYKPKGRWQISPEEKTTYLEVLDKITILNKLFKKLKVQEKREKRTKK